MEPTHPSQCLDGRQEGWVGSTMEYSLKMRVRFLPRNLRDGADPLGFRPLSVFFRRLPNSALRRHHPPPSPPPSLRASPTTLPRPTSAMPSSSGDAEAMAAGLLPYVARAGLRCGPVSAHASGHAGETQGRHSLADGLHGTASYTSMAPPSLSPPAASLLPPRPAQRIPGSAARGASPAQPARRIPGSCASLARP